MALGNLRLQSLLQGLGASDADQYDFGFDTGPRFAQTQNPGVGPLSGVPEAEAPSQWGTMFPGRSQMETAPFRVEAPTTPTIPDVSESYEKYYTPSDMAQLRLSELLKQYPERESPGFLSRLQAGLAGFSTVGTPNQSKMFDIQQGILNAPHDRAVADWKLQVDPAIKAADLERASNVNERTLAYNIAQSEYNRLKQAEVERNNRERNEATLIRARAYDYAQRLPRGRFQWNVTGPTALVHNQDTGEIIDTGIETGKMDEQTKQELINSGRLGVVQQQGANQMAVAQQYGANQLATQGLRNQGALEVRRLANEVAGRGSTRGAGGLLPAQIRDDWYNKATIMAGDPKYRDFITLEPSQNEFSIEAPSQGYFGPSGPTQELWNEMRARIFGPPQVGPTGNIQLGAPPAVPAPAPPQQPPSIQLQPSQMPPTPYSQPAAPRPEETMTLPPSGPADPRLSQPPQGGSMRIGGGYPGDLPPEAMPPTPQQVQGAQQLQTIMDQITVLEAQLKAPPPSIYSNQPTMGNPRGNPNPTMRDPFSMAAGAIYGAGKAAVDYLGTPNINPGISQRPAEFEVGAQQTRASAILAQIEQLKKQAAQVQAGMNAPAPASMTQTAPPAGASATTQQAPAFRPPFVDPNNPMPRTGQQPIPTDISVFRPTLATGGKLPESEMIRQNAISSPPPGYVWIQMPGEPEPRLTRVENAQSRGLQPLTPGMD